MPRGVPKERRCLACTHNKEPMISKDAVLGNGSLSEIGERYGLSRDVIHRHKQHIDEAKKRRIFAQAARDEEVTEQQEIAGRLNDERVEVQSGLKRCIKEIERILEEAKGDEDRILQLAALKEMRSALIDLAKIYGTLKQSLTINVSLTDSPEWLELRSILVDVFREHPAAERMFVEKARRLNVALPRPQ